MAAATTFAALLAASALAASAPPPAPSSTLEDRILAAVDDDPILASDVERVVGLGLVERLPDESDQALRRRVLEGLIEQSLRFHEVDRYGFGQVSVDAITQRTEEIRSRFPTEADYEARLRQLDLDEEGLRQLVARQLMILAYVDDRLGARVFVSLDDIRAYYQDVLTPEMKSRGQPVPPIESVREQIRSVLKEQRLDDEIRRWTDQLRQKADVVNYFDEQREELPPVVETITKPPAP